MNIIVNYLIRLIWKHFYRELCTFIRQQGKHIHSNPTKGAA